MKNKYNKAFTLVELIVVITILAVLGTIGFLSFQSYTVYSRDVTRLSNLNVLKSGLEIQYTKGGNYAEPDDSVEITASGTLIRKQGLFAKKALRVIRASSDASKDPLTGEYYDYVVGSNLQEYQLVGYMEGEEISNNFINSSFASGTGFTMKSMGGDLGLVFDNGVAIHKSGSGADIRDNGGKTYTIKFDQGDEITSATGSELFSNVYNRSKNLLKNKSLAKLDDSLVLYFDMETITNDGKMRNLGNGEDGICYNKFNPVDCSFGMFGDGKKFSRDNNHNINTKIQSLGKPFTISTLVKTGDTNNSFEGIIGKYIYPYKGFFIRYSQWNGTNLHFQTCVASENGNSYKCTNNEIIREKDKYFITVIYDDNNTLSMFINGNKVGKTTGEFMDVNFELKIGSTYDEAEYTNGTIYDTRIYNRALSEKEIKMVYGSTLK